MNDAGGDLTVQVLVESFTSAAVGELLRRIISAAGLPTWREVAPQLFDISITAKVASVASTGGFNWR
jgi:hypothetical protein